MVDLRHLQTNDGTGIAVLAHIQTVRAPGGVTLDVDSVDNWPSYFIATTGTVNANGYILEAGKKEFRGHLTGADITIDGWEPGSTDNGNTTSEVVIIKQTSNYAQSLADTLRNVLNDDSTIKSSAISTILAAIGGNATGWWPITGTPVTAAAYLGNRSYSLTTNIDFGTFATPGYRIGLNRTVAAATQVATLNGTNQYFSKAAPAGTWPTTNFTVMYHGTFTSYQDGLAVGRVDATPANGFWVGINSVGQVWVRGYNAGVGNYRQAVSQTVVPLNKKVHIAATWAAGTILLYIDGVLVPSVTSTAGTAPTAVVAAGDFAVGRPGSFAASYHPGKVGHAAVFSSALSQATILSYISQGFTGAESTIVGAWSLNNTPNDLSANANHLTAQNGATYAADSFFGTQADGTIDANKEHAIMQRRVSATNIIVQVPEGCAIPTIGGVGAIRYAPGQTSPYGFPSQKDKWRIKSAYKTIVANGATTAGTWYNTGSRQLTVPVGEWEIGFSVTPYYFRSSTSAEFKGTMSVANNSESNPELTIYEGSEGASGNIAARITAGRSTTVSATTSTPYYLNFTAVTNNLNDAGWFDSVTPGIMYADNSLL